MSFTGNVRVAFILVISTVGLIIGFGLTLNSLEAHKVYVSSHWSSEGNQNLVKSPAWFKMDSDSLYTLKPIGDKEKELLVNLYPKDSVGFVSYSKSIDDLAFKSFNQSAPAWILFLACGLAACLGVMIQSLWAFVGHVSYRGDLDIPRWWSWYVVRPFIAFAISIVFVLLYQSGIYEGNIDYGPSTSSYLLVGLNALGGIGLNDFLQRVRSISKAIFGGK